MERLVTRIGNEPAVPTEFDMDFAFDLDKETFDKLQRIFNRLCDLTDILGDEYDLDQLKEMVVHGRWLNFYGDFTCAECSECGATYDVVNVKPSGEIFREFEKEYKFCPNCGAKMDFGDDK